MSQWPEPGGQTARCSAPQAGGDCAAAGRREQGEIGWRIAVGGSPTAEVDCACGNAVVGVDLDYEMLDQGNGMLMVSASGTAVVVE